MRYTAVYTKPVVLLCVQYNSWSCWPKKLHLLPSLFLPPSRPPTILLSLNAPKRLNLYVKGILYFLKIPLPSVASISPVLTKVTLQFSNSCRMNSVTLLG